MNKNLFQNILEKLTHSTAKLNRIKRLLQQNRVLDLTGLTGAARGFFVSYLANNTDRPILIITPGISSALRYYNDLELTTNKQVDYLPTQEASPYELVYSDSAVLKQQLSVLESFKESGSNIAIASAKALLNTYLSRKISESNSFRY